MKAYLVVSGSLFGLLGLAHFARTVAESSRLATEPSFWLVGPGLGALGAALAVWSVKLFRQLSTP
jgi:hypothetical protein